MDTRRYTSRSSNIVLKTDLFGNPFSENFENRVFTSTTMKTAMLNCPSSPLVASHPFCGRSLHQAAAPSKTCLKTNKRRCSTEISALRRDDYSDKLIDEDMIVLRMRIQEMKIAERNYEVSSEWMEWEKRYYRDSYNSDVCEAVGLLQSVLMKSRPSLVLGMVGLVGLSIPMSIGLAMFHLVQLLLAGNINHL